MLGPGHSYYPYPICHILHTTTGSQFTNDPERDNQREDQFAPRGPSFPQRKDTA